MSRNLFRANRKKRRGQGLVEYIFIVAAVAFIALVALSHFGHKVADQYAIGAGMLPGAHAEDNLPIATGHYAGVNESDTEITANGAVGWVDINGTETQGDANNLGIDAANAGNDPFVAGDD